MRKLLLTLMMTAAATACGPDSPGSQTNNNNNNNGTSSSSGGDVSSQDMSSSAIQASSQQPPSSGAPSSGMDPASSSSSSSGAVSGQPSSAMGSSSVVTPSSGDNPGSSGQASSGVQPSSGAPGSSSSTPQSSSDLAPSSSTVAPSSGQPSSSAGGSSSSGGMPVQPDRCDVAQELIPGVELTGQSTVGAQDDYGTGTNCNVAMGKDLAYRIQVPAGGRAQVQVVPAPGYDVTISALLGPDPSACSALPRQCIGGADDAGRGGTELLQMTNTANTAQTWFILVDSPHTDPSTFSILFTLPSPPPGDLCDGAPQLAMGTTADISMDGFFDDYDLESRRDRAWSVVVPAHKRVTITRTLPVDDYTSVLALFASPADCTGNTPLISAWQDFFSTDNAIAWSNHTSAPVTLFLLLDTGSYGTTPLYTVTAALDDYPANDVCQDAQLLPYDTSVPVALVGYTNDYHDAPAGSSCASAVTSAADRLFALDVPAGKVLRVATTPGDANNTTRVVLLDGCSPLSCLADASGYTTPFNVAYLNNGTQPRHVFVMVELDASSASTPLLQATLSDPVPGDLCSSATPLTLGMATPSTTLGAVNDVTNYGGNCGGAPGPERFYTVTVPAGRTLEVATSMVDASLDAELFILTQCAPLQCVAHRDATYGGDPEILTWTNTGGDITVVVGVDGYAAGDSGNFTILARLL